MYTYQEIFSIYFSMSIRHQEKRMKIYQVLLCRYCLLPSALNLRKIAYVWGCLYGVWGCLDGVWMGSESVWECINTRMSWYQDIAIPNPLANFKLGHTRILPFLPVPSIAKTSMSGGVWMVSEGFWIMSRWCLRVSGEASIPNLLA